MPSFMTASHPSYTTSEQCSCFSCVANLAAPSGEVGLQCEDSLPEQDAEPALMSEFSSDTSIELEDELCHF